jgi:hypothetical protein
MFVRTLVTGAGPRDVPVTVSKGHLTPGNRHLDRRHTAWPPVTLRERALSAGGACEKRTKPPGTSASLAFPCERADHLEVSCSERYRQSQPPSNDCGKPNFHSMWTTVWKRCAPNTLGLWTTLLMRWNLRVGCVETTLASGLTYFAWLFIASLKG